ncbi:ATP-binding protein [Halalkalibacillus halophilus]|uniref:ATP-binding protein n=1 Tax=Halalkalibacillus halophilus TaxID=392827 RepID=UPI0004220E93|nr:ATP-binding protein [Halalkalibacillus halophilus]
MFWKSVVFKLWLTIIVLVVFVLMILTVLLLEFFENYFVEDTESNLMNQAENVYAVMEGHDDDIQMETVNQLTDPSTRVTVFFDEHQYWESEATQSELPPIDPSWFVANDQINEVFEEDSPIRKTSTIPSSNEEVIIVGIPTPDQGGAIYVYQSLGVVEETTAQTTRIILLAASIAVILTTVFAFFLSSRITAPLIKMRKAAAELSRGEFHTTVPVLTYDEVGELANSFNRMRRQLNYHITELNHEKSQLSSILKSMADGVISVNKKQEVMLINPPAEHFLEQYSFEIEDTVELLPTQLQEYFKTVLDLEQERQTEIVVQGRSYVVAMTPLYDQNVVRGVVAIIRDMTDERQLDKLRKDFLANVSHELRTPISMMQGYSEAIVDDIAETKEDKQELAQIIYDESLRMGRLVNELLDLARMEAGHIQLNKEEIDIHAFIHRIARKFSFIATEQNISFETFINPSLDFHVFDPDRIEQVLTNLIDNALRHTHDSGRVKIEATSDQEQLVIDVNDSGTGIPDEDLPFVFERFYKSDKARTRESTKKGTGLGLSIAKHIVEAHDGQIYVKSRTGEGTTFSIYLPKA